MSLNFYHYPAHRSDQAPWWQDGDDCAVLRESLHIIEQAAREMPHGYSDAARAARRVGERLRNYGDFDRVIANIRDELDRS